MVCCPGAHFTNNFSITIQMWWKFHLALIQVLIKWSLQNLAHGQLSWHVPNFVAIWSTVIEWELNDIPSNLKCDGKIVSEMGPRVTNKILELKSHSNRSRTQARNLFEMYTLKWLTPIILTTCLKLSQVYCMGLRSKDFNDCSMLVIPSRGRKTMIFLALWDKTLPSWKQKLSWKYCLANACNEIRMIE